MPTNQQICLLQVLQIGRWGHTKIDQLQTTSSVSCSQKAMAENMAGRESRRTQYHSLGSMHIIDGQIVCISSTHPPPSLHSHVHKAWALNMYSNVYTSLLYLNSYYVATGSDCDFHTCTATGRQLGHRQDIARGFINMLFLSCCSSDCLHPIILSAGQIHLICTRVLSRIMSLERKLYEALSRGVQVISPKEDFRFSHSAAIHEYNSEHGNNLLG